ncbi:MAG TPA: hypothetical protein PKO09_16215 [Anaerolineae bacterium]|nr:hypothetical protein [Anaerolineae bacterium]
MRLTYGRCTARMLAAALFVTLGLVAAILATGVEPVHADACGTNYLYQWTCRLDCDQQYSCGPGKWLFVCVEEKAYKYTNPWSDKDMGPTGYMPTNCTEWWDQTCPWFCNW